MNGSPCVEAAAGRPPAIRHRRLPPAHPRPAPRLPGPAPGLIRAEDDDLDPPLSRSIGNPRACRLAVTGHGLINSTGRRGVSAGPSVWSDGCRIDAIVRVGAPAIVVHRLTPRRVPGLTWRFTTRQSAGAPRRRIALDRSLKRPSQRPPTPRWNPPRRRPGNARRGGLVSTRRPRRAAGSGSRGTVDDVLPCRRTRMLMPRGRRGTTRKPASRSRV